LDQIPLYSSNNKRSLLDRDDPRVVAAIREQFDEFRRGVESTYGGQAGEDQAGAMRKDQSQQASTGVGQDRPDQDTALAGPEGDGSRNEEQIDHEEQQAEEEIRAATDIGTTERQQLIRARRGQGLFRENVQRFERCCRITGVADPRFLIASHILPWRYATNPQRLDGENGLLLTPNVDYLFDRGFISFRDDGVLLLAPSVSADLFKRLGVPTEPEVNCGRFTEGQQAYLREHRGRIFLAAC
jgi:hypothetical protein